MPIIAFFAICFAAVVASPTAFTGPSRIVGGTATYIENYPSMASMLLSHDGINFRQYCGASILNRNSLMIAGHCLNPSRGIFFQFHNIRFRLGSTWAHSGGVVYNVRDYVIHPDFDAITFDSDLAIVHCSEMITYNAQIQQARIAGPNYHLADNQVVWATGWGAISDNGPGVEQLRHVQIWTINQRICTERYDFAGDVGGITDNMLCSGWLDIGGRDQCYGDSGGPLYHHGIVVGVSSFGYRCGHPYYPGVNTRVSQFTSWIQNNA